MNTRIVVLLVSAAVGSSVGLFARSPAAIGQTDSGVPTITSQSTPPASTTVSVRGTIDQYDPSSRMLSLATSNGTVHVQVPVASAARIRQGWHQVDPLELQKLAGYQATVRYRESGDSKTVESVHVFGNEKKER
jgi:hypothetical protein